MQLESRSEPVNMKRAILLAIFCLTVAGTQAQFWVSTRCACVRAWTGVRA